MQFNLDKSFDSIACSNTSSAADVIKSIGAVENKYQLELEDMYTKLEQLIMKRMRRATPVTGQKFDWQRADGVIKWDKYALGLIDNCVHNFNINYRPYFNS